MEALGYYNGKIEALDELKVSVNDRGFYFGDGVYDFVLVVNDRPFAIDDHIDRFFNSAALIDIKFPYTKEEFKQILLDLSGRLEVKNKALYMQLTRGTAPRAHVFPPESVKPNLFITVKPCEMKNLYKKIRLISTDDNRYSICNIKTINLLPNVLAAQKAEAAGCGEAVFVRDGFVTEGAHSNVHILKDGALITHPTDNLILPGIARKHLVALAKKLGIKVEERPFTPTEILDADEVMVSSTSGPLIAAYEFDGKSIGGKDEATLSALREAVIAEINA